MDNQPSYQQQAGGPRPQSAGRGGGYNNMGGQRGGGYHSQQHGGRGGSSSEFRGRGGGGGGRGGYGGGRGGRGGYGNDHRGGDHQQQQDRPREPRERKVILDMNKYMKKRIVVKFIGGREVTGILAAFDPLNNLVLDDVVESYTVENKVAGQSFERKRNLGTIVARGQQIMALAPEDGYVEIDNPFLMDDDE